MSILELIKTAKSHIIGEPSKRRPVREAFRAEDTPRSLIDELAVADYGHLPEPHSAAK